MGRYDAQNPAALKRLVSTGTQLRPFPPDVMDACWKAAHEIYAEESAKNPMFKRLWESHSAFRADSYLWWQVAELTYDSYQIRQRAKG